MNLFSTQYRNVISAFLTVGILLSLSPFVPASFAAPKMIDQTAAVVNDEPILESDIDSFQKKMKSKSFQELFGGIPQTALNSRESALRLLVEEKLVDQQVKKLELTASEQEVQGQIKFILKRNGITQSQLADRLKQLGSTLEDYKEGIKRQIERRNLIDREVRPSMDISEEQLRHFYLRSLKNGESELEYKLAHILIAFKTKDAKGKVAAEKRAATVWKEIQAHSEKFVEMAKEYSDDLESQDGVLGYFPLSSLSKEFRSAVVKMKEGQVSKPIKMEDGFHILKLEETRLPDFSNLPKDAKENLRNQMVASELERKMALWIEKKKKDSNIRYVGPSPVETPQEKP